MIIGDIGNVRPGTPTLTTALRGMANVIVEARTLESAKHSGQYGGAAPDALLALVRRWRRCTTSTATSPSRACAATSGTGADTPRRSSASWPRSSTAAADRHRQPRLARVVRARDHRHRDRRALGRRRAQRRLAVGTREAERARAPRAGRRRGAGARWSSTCESQRPFGIEHRGAPRSDGQRLRRPHRQRRLRDGHGRPGATRGTPTGDVGVGGSIPLVSALPRGAPDAEIRARRHGRRLRNIHGPNERVLLDEFEKATIAEADAVRAAWPDA